jgi:hypothetical protein
VTKSSGALPGKSWVIYEPELEMASDLFACEDGHAQERALLSGVLPTLVARDLAIIDRNLCVRDFLHGITSQEPYFICRQHKGLSWEADGEERFAGRGESGAIYEQWVRVSDSHGNVHRYRRIRIVLKKATRDGDKVLTLLTNLSKTAAHAKQIAEMYRKRWTIETALQELEAHLHSEINSLGYPKAALFAPPLLFVQTWGEELFRASFSFFASQRVANSALGSKGKASGSRRGRYSS